MDKVHEVASTQTCSKKFITFWEIQYYVSLFTTQLYQHAILLSNIHITKGTE